MCGVVWVCVCVDVTFVTIIKKAARRRHAFFFPGILVEKGPERKKKKVKERERERNYLFFSVSFHFAQKWE